MNASHFHEYEVNFVPETCKVLFFVQKRKTKTSSLLQMQIELLLLVGKLTREGEPRAEPRGSSKKTREEREKAFSKESQS